MNVRRKGNWTAYEDNLPIACVRTVELNLLFGLLLIWEYSFASGVALCIEALAPIYLCQKAVQVRSGRKKEKISVFVIRFLTKFEHISNLFV